MTGEPFALHGRVVVVTGASGGIGRAVARALAEAGARVALVGRSAESLKSTEVALGEHAAMTASWTADVLEPEQLAEVRDRITAHWGSIDALVNLAGGNVAAATLTDDASPFNLDLAAFRHVLELNLLGTVHAIVCFGPALAAAQSGQSAIVNVSSMAADRALTGVGGYGAAKAAVESITRWFGVEFARRKIPIRVNAIAPGFVLGVQNRGLLLNEEGKPSARAERIVAQTPLGRLGAADDIAGAVIWLCGDESRFVTGAVIPIDGGFGAFAGI